MANKGVYSITTIACKGVFRKLFRNSVLVLAVSLLVSLLVFSLLFNNAVKATLETATKKLGADIVLVPVEAIDNAEEFILESKDKTFYMDKDVFDSVAHLPEVKAATYQIYLNTLDSGCCSIVNGQVVAFDQHTDFVIKPWLDNPPPLKEGQVYVGSYVNEYLGLIDTPTLFGHKVKVAAHLKRTGTGLDHGIFVRMEDLNLITAQAAGQYQPGKISIIFLKVKEGTDIDAVVRKIQRINPTIGIMTQGNIGTDVRATLKDIIKIFSITILISTALAILLAWSTFTAMTNERRREVGILRAIGAKQSHIMKIFLIEATIISTIGGLIGVALGHYLLHYLASDFNLLKKLGAIAAFNLTTVLLSLVALLAGVVVCLIGAAVPTIRLARMEPLKAIKEE